GVQTCALPIGSRRDGQGAPATRPSRPDPAETIHFASIPAIFLPMEKLAVVDFGGQYTHLIARRIRQLGVYSEVVPSDVKAEDLAKIEGLKGIILSGGPSSVYEPGAPACDAALFTLGLPVLGLCYGHQLMARTLGGEVSRGLVHEFGPAALRPEPGHPLFRDISAERIVWMS